MSQWVDVVIYHGPLAILGGAIGSECTASLWKRSVYSFRTSTACAVAKLMPGVHLHCGCVTVSAGLHILLVSAQRLLCVGLVLISGQLLRLPLWRWLVKLLERGVCSVWTHPACAVAMLMSGIWAEEVCERCVAPPACQCTAVHACASAQLARLRLPSCSVVASLQWSCSNAVCSRCGHIRRVQLPSNPVMGTVT